MISFRKVMIKTKTGKKLFHETSFEAKNSEIIGLYGPNGSGKSSLMKVISGNTMEREVSGEHWIDEVPLFKSDVSVELKCEKVLYIGSDFQTPFQVSVHEILNLAKHSNKKSSKNVMEVAERFDLVQFLSRNFSDLSDGEKQRVMIARGVIQSPRWLVLDETFSKIDLDHSFQVAKLLREYCNEHHGVMVSSHDLNLLSELVDHLWFIKNGEIIASGLVEDVLTSDQLMRLYPNRNIHVVRSPEDGKKKIIY